MRMNLYSALRSYESRQLIRLCALCFSIASTTTASAQDSNWQVVHTPPAVVEQGRQLELSFQVEPAASVSYAIVYHRTAQGEKFKSSIVRSAAGGRFRAQISGDEVGAREFQYFIRIVDTGGQNHDIFASSRAPQQLSVVEPAPTPMEPGADDFSTTFMEGLDLSGLDGLAAEFQLLQVEDVVFSAAKKVQSVVEAPAAIYVITRDDIAAFGFKSPAEILRYVPGMQVYRVNESTSLVGARGFADESNNLVLMLEQGRELNVELFGSPFLENQSFNLDDIERIEIIRGPGSALYGANAFSGVVQYIPKRPSSYKNRYGVMAEQEFVRGGQHVRLRASGVTDVAEYTVSGRYREERSSSARKDRALRSVATRSGFIFDAGEIPIEMDAGISALEGEQYSILGETTADMWSTYLTARSQLGPVRALLYYNHWDATLGIADPTLAPILPQMVWNTDTINADLSAEFEFGTIDRLSIGLNGRWNRYQSDQMVDPVSSETRFGVFLQNELQPIERLIISTSVRSDFSSLYLPGGGLGDRLTLSPRVGLIVPVDDNHGVRVGFGRAFRKPSFFESQMRIEAFEPLGLNFANSDLKNEVVTGIDLGYTGKSEILRWNVDLFYNLYRDFIEFDPGSVKFANEGRDSDSYGGELSLRYRILPGLQTFVNYSYLFVTVIRDAPLAGQGQTEQFTGDSDPQHMANWGIRYTPESGFVAATALHWQSERVWRILNPNKGSLLFAFNETQRIPAYLNLYAKLGWNFGAIELGIIGEQLQWDRHIEFPGLDDVANPEGIAPAAAGDRYGGERLSSRVSAYVEGRF